MLFEAIKNRNFFPLFNYIDSEEKLHQFINELKSIPSECFTSYDHYVYYRRYVVPKVKLIGREYEWRSAISRYKRYKIRHTAIIYFSDIYMILNFVTNVHYRYKVDDSGSYRFLNDHSHVFIMGFDTNGKLFVNEIPIHFFVFRAGMYRVFDGSGVEIRVVDRGEVIGRLGFDRDVADRELVEVSDVGVYRVQGEVLLNVIRGLGSVEEFYRSLLNRSGIAAYVSTYLMNYVSLALIDMGFSVEPSRSIVIRNVLPSSIIEKPDKIISVLKILGENIVEQLKKYIEVYDVRYSYVKDEYGRNFSVFYNVASSVGLFELHLEFVYAVPTPFTSPYSNIAIDVHVNFEDCEMCKEIESEFIDTLRSTPRQTIKMLIGNHLVELRNVYSGSIEFRPSRRLEVELVQLPPIINNIAAYYVDQESEIAVSHHEHGVTRIRFSMPFLVNFTTTSASEDYPEKLNRIVLHNIVNGVYSNRKVTEFTGGFS
jgi:hypothetical protein